MIAPPALPDERVRVADAGLKEAPALTAANGRMIAFLQGELALSLDQRDFIAQVLLEREKAIEAFHREIRASGVFDPRQYDPRIAEIRSAAFRRMGDVLDSSQHRRYLELLDQRRVPDEVSFRIDPGMVVLE